MNIAILEDNLLQQNKIYTFLKQDHRIDLFSSCLEYQKAKKHYDLLLLDIELKDENGITFIHKNRDKQTFIVYVSSHDECMEDVFDSNVLGFIRKRDIDTKLIHKIYQVQNKLNELNKIELCLPYQKIWVNEDSIIKFELDQVVYAILINEKYTLSNETLKEIEKNLSNNFIRINNQMIVNLHHIDHINLSNHTITLSNQENAQVSVRRWNTLKSKYIEMRTNI